MSLSDLPKTWLIDVDGVSVRHNRPGECHNELLPGVGVFWQQIGEADVVILLTARAEARREETLAFFRAQGLRFDHAIFGLPAGERILINDRKPSGLTTALAVNVGRDEGLGAVGQLLGSGG